MKKAVVFDLDGTLVEGKKAIDGAVDAVSVLQAGAQVFFMANNSGKEQKEIVAKLKGLGFPATLKNTYGCANAVARYVAEKNLSPVFAIGTHGLVKEMQARGVEVKETFSAKEALNVSAVVVGFNPFFNIFHQQEALDFLKKEVKFIVANKDPNFPGEAGRRMVGCGGMVGGIIGATGRNPDFMVGKPGTYMLELLCKDHGLKAEEICVVGDVPESDMMMAKNFGCHGILFDPQNAFQDFPQRVQKLSDIISLVS